MLSSLPNFLYNNQRIPNVRSEAFTMAKLEKIFSGYQLYQLGKNHLHFRDHLCPHHQGLILRPEMVPEMSVTFTQLTWLIPQKDFINIFLLTPPRFHFMKEYHETFSFVSENKLSFCTVTTSFLTLFSRFQTLSCYLPFIIFSYCILHLHV
jgi:hypothetical protein